MSLKMLKNIRFSIECWSGCYTESMSSVISAVGKIFRGPKGPGAPAPLPAADPAADSASQAKAARDALIDRAAQRTDFAGQSSAYDEQYGVGLLSQKRRAAAQDLGLM